jgi:hypothetical protein
LRAASRAQSRRPSADEMLRAIYGLCVSGAVSESHDQPDAGREHAQNSSHLLIGPSLSATYWWPSTLTRQYWYRTECAENFPHV